MKDWGFLLIAIVAETIATSALKASDGFSRLGPATLTLVGYGIAFYFLALTLRSMPVGVAYAIWSGLGVVLITLAGWVIFGQALDAAACSAFNDHRNRSGRAKLVIVTCRRRRFNSSIDRNLCILRGCRRVGTTDHQGPRNPTPPNQTHQTFLCSFQHFHNLF